MLKLTARISDSNIKHSHGSCESHQTWRRQITNEGRHLLGKYRISIIAIRYIIAWTVSETVLVLLVEVLFSQSKPVLLLSHICHPEIIQ